VDLGESIKSNKFAVVEGSVLVSKLNPRIPRVWLPPASTGRRQIASTEFLVLVPHDEWARAFLWCQVRQQLFADDMTWKSVRALGKEDIDTPNLDRLQANSAAFTRGYVPTALCRPALATFANGLYAHQSRIIGNDPSPLPGMAGPAVQMGAWVAKDILRRLAGQTSAPFRWLDLGSMAVIGPLYAVADLRGVRVTGFPGWLLWGLAHLAFIPDTENRITLLSRWLWQIATRQRRALLITGRPDQHIGVDVGLARAQGLALAADEEVAAA
jgi:hypothetical protein